MPIGARLPSPAMLLFNRPIRGLLPQMKGKPIFMNNDAQFEAFKECQDKYVKNNDIDKDFLSFPVR